MEILTLMALVVIGAWLLNTHEQSRRIALLGSHLGKYQIERLMESLTDGYLRWLGEEDPARRDQIWGLLETTEQSLAGQFKRFAADIAKIGEPEARVSKLTVSLPLATQLFPVMSFDVRKAFVIHARAIGDAAANTLEQTDKGKAYMMTAELFLMQHTCHWFCKSKSIASARLLARHKTSYQQVVDSVAPATRMAYGALIASPS